ncbi:MAG: chloramphenicol acetyltransferase [Candidatus Izemoplasmatales bacterium]|nr:chloramphenicol acetyltransferase [bacterium]MDZ4195943.1 chloramphenicol acetyltransferase [Candidatus Izemoplasmatales bacterium]
MKWIELSSWKRKNHYELFKSYQKPHFNVTFELDITSFYEWCKGKNYPFFLTFLHEVMKVANQIEAFLLRIRGDGVVIHDVVHASFTMMLETGLFRFIRANYQDDLESFIEETTKVMQASTDVDLIDEDGIDDLVFVTTLPWVPFTSIEHAMPLKEGDSFPRISWGKFHFVGEKRMIPFSVSAHHALVDGVDVGVFYEQLQRMLMNYLEKI